MSEETEALICAECKSRDISSYRIAASTRRPEHWVYECDNGHIVKRRNVESAEAEEGANLPRP